MMARGTNPSIRADRGFGFMAPEGATVDLFSHGSDVEGTGFASLRAGQFVAFVAGTDPRNA
jgi:CspA family cold shock protein